MLNKKKSVFNWSGGKDSALALQKILNGREYEPIALLTTINEEDQTSSIHDIPLEFLVKQAKSIGIPLYPVFLSKDKKTYEEGMREAVDHFQKLGVGHFIFGDIFLEEVKEYRESKLNSLGIEVVEPLWGKGSKAVMKDFLKSGIKSKVIVTQANQLNQTFIGREINDDFITSLPIEIDLCGENGEYHSFVYDGSFFKSEIPFKLSRPHKITHSFKMNSGEIKDFEYWKSMLLS